MKLLCLITLFVYATIQGAVLQDDVVSGSNSFQNLQLRLSHESEDSASGLSEADLLFISEIEELEKIHGRNIVADAIHNALEGLRDTIINGNENMDPLDPLVVPHIGPFVYRAPAVSITAEVTDFTMTGLAWFVLDRFTFNPLTLAIGAQVTIPWVDITGSYDANAFIAFLHHNAGGLFRVFVHRIEVGLDMRLGTNIFGGGHLFLRTLDINIDIHDTQIQIHGLTGSSVLNSLINSILQSSTQEIVQSQLEPVSQMLSEQLFDVIDGVLREFTISDILG